MAFSIFWKKIQEHHKRADLFTGYLFKKEKHILHQTLTMKFQNNSYMHTSPRRTHAHTPNVMLQHHHISLFTFLTYF